MKNLSQRIAAIRDDHEHGSRWLVREAIHLLYELASEPVSSSEQQMMLIQQAGRELALARPAMAALRGAVERILAVQAQGLAAIALASKQLDQEYTQAIARLTTNARPYLEGTLMTHSLSQTVQEVLISCLSVDQELIILEGRPLYEGRTLALSLKHLPVHLTLITDAQAEIFMPLAQAVVVGADSVLADGGLINKAGTALLARSAQAHRVPFYVLTETLKISSRSWTGDLAWLEEQQPDEVGAAIPGVTIRNFYFDYTPAHLISGIITEQGLFTPAKIQQYAAQLAQIPELT